MKSNPSCDPIARDIPDWLTHPFPDNQSNKSISNFSIEGLSLQVEIEGPSISQWVKEYMAPLNVEDTEEINRHWVVKIGENTSFLPKLIRFLRAINLYANRVKLKYKTIRHVRINDHISVCFRPSQGIVWIIDRSKNQIFMILSARTKYPMLEVSTTLRSIIISHLSDQNWHLFHAGAVEIDQKTHLVVGNGGAGKTSLIIALMSKGARFISNERILLKLENNQIKSLPFPMPIAVGLGTAAQYPILADFVKHSDLLKLPMRRFSPRSIKNIKPSDWGEQTGKIQLLAGELVDALHAPEYLQGGAISKILLPSINADTPFKIEAAEDQYLQKVLSKNYLPQSKEHHYPNWLPLNFKEAAPSSAEQVLKALGRIDAEKVHFFDASQVHGLL